MQIPRGLKPTRNNKGMGNSAVGLMVCEQTILQAYSRLVKRVKSRFLTAKAVRDDSLQRLKEGDLCTNAFARSRQIRCNLVEGLHSTRKDSLVNGYN